MKYIFLASGAGMRLDGRAINNLDMVRPTANARGVARQECCLVWTDSWELARVTTVNEGIYSASTFGCIKSCFFVTSSMWLNNARFPHNALFSFHQQDRQVVKKGPDLMPSTYTRHQCNQILIKTQTYAPAFLCSYALEYFSDQRCCLPKYASSLFLVDLA